MNRELKAYLDDWQARQKRVFDDHLARMDAHLRFMQDITGCVTGPVQASSGTSELVTASAGLSEPPAPAPSIVASPVVAPAAHIDTIAMVPASCSTECATQAVTASTTPTLLPWVSVSSSSPATSTTNSVVSTELATDIDDGKHDASLNDNSVNAVPLSVAPALSLTAGARDDSTPSHMSPTRCSTYGSTTDAVVSLQLIQVRVPEALVVTSASSATTDDVSEVVHDAHSGIIRSMPLAMEEALLSDQVLQPLWPPTPRDMNQCNSSKPRPIPWPSFEDLPGGVHLTEPRPQLQGTLEVAAAMRGFDQEEQFTYLCANLNMLEKFLKKPGAEWEAAIWSDLTSRAPRAFKLWCIPWVSFLFLDLRPPWPPPVQINFSGLCSFAQLDTEDTLPMFPWNPGPAMRSSSAVLYDEWVLPSWDSGQQADASYDQFPCAVRNAYEPGYFVTGGLAFPDLPSSRVPTAIPLSRRLELSTQYDDEHGIVTRKQSRVLVQHTEEPWDPGGPTRRCYAPVLRLYWNYSHLNLYTWYSTLHCISASHENYASDNLTIEGKEVLITWSLPNIYCCNTTTLQSSNGTMDSELLYYYQACMVQSYRKQQAKENALSGIKQPSRASKLATALFFWVPTGLDDEANQHWNIPWDPGGCMFVLCNSHKWWITPELNHLHCLEGLQCFFARASRILSVAWDADDLEFSTGCGQTPSQGGRDVMNPGVFFDQVHVDHDYYLACVSQITINYNFYLNEALYFDTIYNNLKDYHGDFIKTKEIRMPWDPGKVSPLISSQASAWGQAEF